MKPTNETLNAYLLLYKSLLELYSEYELVFFGEISTKKKSKIDFEGWKKAKFKIIGQECRNGFC